MHHSLPHASLSQTTTSIRTRAGSRRNWLESTGHSLPTLPGTQLHQSLLHNEFEYQIHASSSNALPPLSLLTNALNLL